MRGIFLLIEAVRQLRGQAGPAQVPDCEVALAIGSGGWLSLHRRRSCSGEGVRSVDVLRGREWTKPLPDPDPVAAPFWEAAGEGGLLYQECPACGHRQFYPRAVCTACGAEPRWPTASGRGAVHTYTIVRQYGAPPFRDELPYVVGDGRTRGRRPDAWATSPAARSTRCASACP